MIDHLPRESFFVEELLNDEQFATQMANADLAEEPKVRERLSEWSPLREGLARIEDQLRGLRAAVIATTGTKPPTVQPADRPTTAVARVRREKRTADHLSLVARVLPQADTAD